MAKKFNVQEDYQKQYTFVDPSNSTDVHRTPPPHIPEIEPPFPPVNLDIEKIMKQKSPKKIKSKPPN
ncbi:3414_t:CDS:1, partial [Ambispora leptoticha]